jgi:hypothetical protein
MKGIYHNGESSLNCLVDPAVMTVALRSALAGSTALLPQQPRLVERG